MLYKNCNGTVEWSKEDRCLFRKVIGLKSLYTFELHKTLNVDVEEAIDHIVE